MKTLILALLLLAAPCHACEHATATYYHPRFEGRPMADGSPYRCNGFTCASRDYPMHAWLRVTHAGRTVLVRVTDRTKLGSHVLDLSKAAFAALADTDLGTIKVTVDAEVAK